MEFETIWRTFRGPLRTLIIRQTHRAQEAEDILQDVFLKIYSRMDSLRDEQKLRPWIYQIARHAIIDYYRKEKPVVALPAELPESNEPDETNLNKELAQCLRKMIRKLPEKYREAIQLTEFEGLSQKDLSERLGLSFSGAKSRVQRGRQMLKKFILDCCHLDLDRYGNILDFRAKNPACRCNFRK